jgi:hypothetical protein
METNYHSKDKVLELESVTSSASKIFEANYHSSSSCVFCIDPLLLALKECFVCLQIAHPMTQKITQFG